MAFVLDIQNTHPKSFHYFELFYTQKYSLQIDFEQFIKIDFSFQLGVFVDFFNSVSTDVDVYSIEQNALKHTIKDSFAQYEEYLFLDS